MTSKKQVPLVWTAADLATLVQLGESNMNWSYIGRVLNRTANACEVRFYVERRRVKSEQAAAAGQYNRLAERRASEARASAAREARIMQPARSLTAEIFGDPLPGRSALDQRMIAERPKITLPTMQSGAAP